MPNAPRRHGAERDTFNDQLRANEDYRAFLRSIGANPDGPLRLSGNQRSRAEQWVRSRFQGLPGSWQIDPAGNVNSDHGLSTAWTNPGFRYPLIAAGALGTAGALGAFGGVTGATGAVSGTALPSSTIAGTHLAVPGAATGGGGMGFFGTLGRFFGGNVGSRLVDTAGNIIGGQIQSGANDRAAELQDRYLRDALAYQQEQDRLAREQYQREYDRRIAIEDSDRTRRMGFEDARDRRLAPYRAIAEQATGYRTLAGLLDPANRRAGAPRTPIDPSATALAGGGRRLADLL